MKKNALLVALCICIFYRLAIAQPYRSSLGVLANVGTKAHNGVGPDFKIFFSSKSAGEATFFFTRSGYYLTLLYEYHFSLVKEKNLNAYIGAGIYNIIIPRGAAGLEYTFTKLPLTISADWRPYYIYFSDDDIDPNEGYRHFGLSLRYVLKR